MTRPKVDPDKRQRTAQACDSCKRRKQKCNGLKPCQTCGKRNLTCSYGAPDGLDDLQASPKRRMLDSPTNDHLHHDSPITHQWASQADSHHPALNGLQEADVANMKAVAHTISMLAQNGNGPKREEPEDAASTLDNDKSTVNGPEEEAPVYSNTRMLQDPTGRLLYIGDSATLSFLQLIRMIVENVAGPSQFTLDPRRHRIVEATIAMPEGMRRTHLLPDRATANVLVEAYFTNISGLVEICPRKPFLATLETCYTDPLSVDPSWLCLLFLTFAIGLVMAAPMPGTAEEAIIQKLRDEEVNRAEVFYLDAKHLADPSSGFEDAGFWSVQALTLMSVYNLAVSKRNASYAYYGMAVRSAFALGLHREETMCIFSISEQSVRRNLWRSLFVLDRFLAASLGRPTAIRESDCSGTTLLTGEKSFSPYIGGLNTDPTSSALEASVRSCHVIGVILEKVYSNRKISTKLAQEIADHCKGWPRALDPSLHHRQASAANPTQGIAILHVNLLYCHSIILLTRPFFLFQMNKVHAAQVTPEKHGTRMVKFAEACVIASSHTVSLVQSALEGQYLPHRNPFVLYFLFAAALVVLSNEFSALTPNSTAATTISNAIHIMHFFAQHDPQGSRLLFILTSYREVVIRQQASRPGRAPEHNTNSYGLPSVNSLGLRDMPTPSALSDDPLENIFAGNSFPSNSLDPRKRNSTTSTPNDLASPHPLSRPLSHPSEREVSRSNSIGGATNSSMDHFFDLARMSGQGGAGSDGDSMEAEIDFDCLWKWPGSVPTPSGGPGAGMGMGMMGMGLGAGNVQGVSDSNVPLFGMNNVEFGGG